MQEIKKVLLLEDRPEDADLLRREVARILPWVEFRLTASREEFLAALVDFHPDLILSDYYLPDFDGMAALHLTREHDPEIPFIIVTGSTNEETAVECIRAGAWNYILKDRLRRLEPAIKSAVERRLLLKERRQDLVRLREREARYRSLFNNNHAVMMILEPEGGRIIDANPLPGRQRGGNNFPEAP